MQSRRRGLQSRGNRFRSSYEDCTTKSVTTPHTHVAKIRYLIKILPSSSSRITGILCKYKYRVNWGACSHYRSNLQHEEESRSRLARFRQPIDSYSLQVIDFDSSSPLLVGSH